ncbi:type III-A CRISPR-associated RAMP protein Csm5 [Thermococcus piezophilus]|uniref:CRISPR system Cms protein Csm5 n=1 Tax=Thermococcus piezophilus TaxID=1712654 RepID=A0A172WEE9_9EURY|nr:type III-A CRISPR-associated RAMP protein Csm5 [Thermococcus piezophilus]ANF21775.1 type III-A CRISPR-associated RAMP protein Csm5 [Thermococcus piezophilus]
MTERTLKVLSPLHIGTGNELTPVDIYPRENIIHVLDTERLVNDLMNLGVELNEILALLKNPPGDAYIWKGYIEEFHLDPSDYSIYTLKIHGKIGRKSMQIKEFIKLNGRPYIPGSSLKGAIRTAVLYKALKECGDARAVMRVVSKVNGDVARDIGRNEDVLDYYMSSLSRDRVDRKRADDLLEAIVFGMEPDSRSKIRYEPKRDPMKALIVRDSKPVGRKHLAVYRVEVIGNPQPIPIWVEAIESGAATDVEIHVDTEALRLNADYFNGLLWECLKERGEPGEVFEDFLWEAVDEFYREVMKQEVKEIQKFRGYSSQVKSFYTSIKEYPGHVLRLGWGSGWLAMTIGLLLVERGYKWENVRKKLGLGKKPGGSGFSREFPKTRRLADGMPMGWVVLE